VLPAFFLRQLDVELFGAGARDPHAGLNHLALGGALTLQTGIWLLPVYLQYQVARRTTDDRAVTHLLTLGM
jgi:hypothetical protein